MNFELKHSLLTLGERTPTFFTYEALASGDMTAKMTATGVLSTPASPKAVTLLTEILRLV